MTLKEERILTEHIKQLVREAFYEMGGYMQQENGMMEKKKPSKKPNHKRSSKRQHGMAMRRKAVIDALDTAKNGQGEIKLDVAPYAYALWPDKDKDSARSYFYKCLKGEKNDSGVPYEFDDSEINRLYSMLSNNAM